MTLQKNIKFAKKQLNSNLSKLAIMGKYKYNRKKGKSKPRIVVL